MISDVMEALNRRAPGFLTLLGLGFAYALPLFLDGRYYLDDLPRAMNGITHWETEGRLLASIVSSLISFRVPNFSSSALIDTSPMPQLLGLAALAYGAARLAQRLFGNAPRLLQLLVVFPVIGSPFMLQNLAYKFDAFTMGLSVMLALVAATLSRGNAKWAAPLMVLAPGLYQASVNVFLGACALLWVADSWNGNEAPFRNAARTVMFGLAGLMAYSVLIFLSGGISGPYATEHGQLLPFTLDSLSGLTLNALSGVFMVSELMTDAPLLFIGAAINIPVFTYILARRGDQNEPGARLAAGIFAPMAIVIAIMGLLLILASPVIRPRTLMGFSIFLVYAAFASHEALSRFPRIASAAIGSATLYLFAMAYGFANASHDQARFDAYLSARIIRDLEAAGFKMQDKLAFDGSQPLSPVAANTAQLNSIARMLQPNMNGNSEWGFRQLEFFGLNSTPVMDATAASLKAVCTEGPLASNMLYQIYAKDSAYVISFGNGVCFKT